jgi:UDP-N-acetylglucosamine 2-epimerase (non-hydrolysing)
MKLKIAHVVGNRPQFIKLGPFLRATKKYNNEIINIIIHSGQHYDYEMSKIFFDDLELPKPDYHLQSGSGTHGVQTGKILQALDEILIKNKPNIVVVYGDTNTTLAGALGAYKLNIPVAHVESGMREGIWRPEEMNKKIADHCSKFCFCPIERACDNLIMEGIPEENIFNTGDITYDAFINSKRLINSKATIELPRHEYILLTMHRAETVDNPKRLGIIINALIETKEYEIIFPIHPRTLKALKDTGLLSKVEKANHIVLHKPLGYFDFNNFLINSKLILTDSSGVLKEAFYALRPCVTLDETTEYKEIFDLGFNILSGFNSEKIKEDIAQMLSLQKLSLDGKVNPFGNGKASEKMVDILINGGNGNVQFR